MRYISIKEAAEKWNVTTRQVQNLCKRGAVDGAKKVAHSWLIPSEAVKPIDGRSKQARKQRTDGTPGLPMPRKAPFLDMTDLYTKPGSADMVIESLADNPEAQALFAAEIAYSRGEIDKVIEQANYFLQAHSGFYAVNAGGMLLALGAMWKGDIHLWREAKLHILEAPARNENDKDIMSLSIACVDSAVHDISEYPDWFTKGQFEHLPPDSLPAAKVFYVKYLLVAAQEMAKSRLKLPDVTGLGLLKCIPYITEPMIVQARVDGTVIPEIYLRLLAAIAYHQTGDDASAIVHIDKAIGLALPDNLLGILAEHRRQFDYLLDERLMLADSNACKRYKKLHKGLLDGWTQLHNSLLSRSVSNAFSVREREIARLAAFGFSDKEICEQLHILPNTVRSNFDSIYSKIGNNDRKRLGAYI